MWPITVPLGLGNRWECARVKNAHKSPSAVSFIKNTQVFWIEKSESLTLVCAGISSAYIVYYANMGSTIARRQEWHDTVGWRRMVATGMHTCVQIFKSTNIQTCNCQGTWFLSSHALWQTHSNSDVCIGLHVCGAKRWLYETSDFQPWCDVSMEMMYKYTSVQPNRI